FASSGSPGRAARRAGAVSRHNGRMTDTPAPDVESINRSIRYAMYSVFRSARPLEGDREVMVTELEAGLQVLADRGVVVRGLYDVSGLRADADLMVWWHAESVEALQEAYQWLRATRVGRHLEPVWSN